MSLDESRPTDTETILNWAGVIRAIAVYVNSLAALVGGDFSRIVTAQNTSATISTFDQIITVNSASAVVLTLDEVIAANVGDWLRVHKIGAGNLTITAGGSDIIADGAAGTSVSNTTAAEAKIAFIEIECVATGQWVIAGMLGTWA